MANIITINFDGIPPAAGGTGLGDRIPPGGYVLSVKKAEETKTGKGKRMIKVSYTVAQPAAYANKNIVENFVFPTPGTDESNFGVARFHALLEAISGQNLDGRGNTQLNLDNLTGKQIIAEIQDREIPANGNFPAKTISQPNLYYRLDSDEGKQLLTLAAPAAPTATASAAAPAPAPAAAPQEPAPAAETPAPTASGGDSLEDELNSMFG